MVLSRIPYWRLSGFYLFYFATLGILVPYWSLYLKWDGFNAQEIGELTAILLGTRIIAPNLWGWIADHKGARMRIVRSASLFGVLGLAGIFISDSYWWVALVMLTFSFFWNASLPQFEVTTLQHLGDYSHHYSKVRVWGSVGFIISVVILGFLLNFYSAAIIPYAMVISLSGIWFVSLIVPESASRHLSLEHVPLRNLLMRKDVIAFLSICFLVQASHGPYYTFYTLYLEQYHYQSGVIGLLWAIGVIAEVIIFLFMHRWLPRFGIRKVLSVSLFLTFLRWLAIGLFPENIVMLTIAQTLHAASFGTYHVAAIAWVHHHFTGRNQGRGQALYSSVSFGAGGALGSLVSGYLWDSAGPAFTFYLAATAGLLAFFISIVGLRER